MSRPIGVIRFPGTNCDYDIANFVQENGLKYQFVWHLDRFDVNDFEKIILPGGFSYGDYLRSGALSALSPVMDSVREFAQKGKPVLGICNGFQILTEAQLLPGSLVQNERRRFIDQWSELELINESSFFGAKIKKQQKVKWPIAHGDGRYFINNEGLKGLQDDGLVWLKYTENPNGSVANIAGVMNKNKNIFGLMPHPERALFDWMGGSDGEKFL